MYERIVNASGTTYLKIPADWRKQHGVGYGNYLDVRETDDGKLLISVPEEDQAQIREKMRESKERW